MAYTAEVIGIHNGIYRNESKEDHAAGLRHPDSFINRLVYFIRLIQMVHGAKQQGYIKGIIPEPAQVSGISLG